MDDDRAYKAWRDDKLRDYPATAADLLVPVSDPFHLSEQENVAILERIRKTNMAVYALRSGGGGPAEVKALGDHFGLLRLDAHLQSDSSCITALEVADEGGRSRYIPYTNRPIKWHTDGYYNVPQERIRGLILHCTRPAVTGGENALMDHEVAYILMRDEDPALVAALCHPRSFVVPPNVEGGEEIRGERPNPVFYVDDETGALGMNYSMRKRNMAWRDEGATTAAVAFLEALLNGDSPYIFRHRMAAGQGLIGNNVLHDRTGFDDGDAASGQGRLMYRGRYFDRVAHT
ncbi:TauD/TfdA family dioxygenase [Magnetospira sp. QH-2]|uniref:TauD/TfdA family dioxygenase n=1 Tax=Magnetospira sp. (strain QH-2) TaxID=1288970 RepID=UPI0018E0693A|nr:TauD/TfdA family dioxygenase [Magnetospira sp. QH-2]